MRIAATVDFTVVQHVAVSVEEWHLGSPSLRLGAFPPKKIESVKHCNQGGRMRFRGLLLIGALVSVQPLMAQSLTVNGPHYNLNIIGVENPKNSNLQDSNRHTIFVALGKNGGIATSIYLVPGEDFQVCDGNGFDAAVDCDGNSKSTYGAVFQLPCNTNIDTDPNVTVVPCDVPEAQQASYTVWARALGKPGGQATAKTCARDLTTNPVTVVCSTGVVIARPTGTKGNKPGWQNVTKDLTSLDITCGVQNAFGFQCDPGETVRAALFTGDFEEWFWSYYNQGLRLTQLRFYLQ